MPDQMANMMEQKLDIQNLEQIVPLVPSPTAATLHLFLSQGECFNEQKNRSEKS